MLTKLFNSEISARQLITEIILILLGYILLLYISNSFKALLYLFSISVGTYIIAHIITFYNLGSGLIDHIQKITVAAMQMADMNVCAHRS